MLLTRVLFAVHVLVASYVDQAMRCTDSSLFVVVLSSICYFLYCSSRCVLSARIMEALEGRRLTLLLLMIMQHVEHGDAGLLRLLLPRSL